MRCTTCRFYWWDKLPLHDLISRNTDPLRSAVLSVTEMHIGNTNNVIDGQARSNG